MISKSVSFKTIYPLIKFLYEHAAGFHIVIIYNILLNA